MKRMKSVFLLALAAILFITGCANENDKETETVKIKSIEDVELVSLKNYSGTYVGDNSDVHAIITNLPGGETMKQLDLSGEMIKITYGFNEGSLSEDEILSYWFDGTDVDKRNFYFNAMYLAILVPNAKEYHFTIDNSTLSVSREKVVEILSETLEEFPDKKNRWNKEVVSKFLDKNHTKIKEIANDYEQFFE